jgi:hypothetical protein
MSAKLSKAGNAGSWALVCRLFGNEEPAHESALSDVERGALASLGDVAVKPHKLDLRYLLCPYCQLQRGRVVQAVSGLACQCPDCGAVPVDNVDRRAWLFDPDWLIRKLRGALNIPAQHVSVPITNRIWRLGTYQRRPVILARSLHLVLQRPSLLGRVRSTSIPWLITPKPLRDIDHDPLAGAATWLPLEERFTLYGGNVIFIAPGVPVEADIVDVMAAVHGPFSEDFRWVHLAGEPDAIGVSVAQAAVFSSLWEFAGKEQDAHAVMSRTGFKSDKPTDLFKVKEKHKGDPKYEGPLRAYKALVTTNQRAGQYAMPCSALTPA